VLGVSGSCWGGWREAGLSRLAPSFLVASVSGFSVYSGTFFKASVASGFCGIDVVFRSGLS
jgi:hypothetical protein